MIFSKRSFILYGILEEVVEITITLKGQKLTYNVVTKYNFINMLFNHLYIGFRNNFLKKNGKSDLECLLYS